VKKSNHLVWSPIRVKSLFFAHQLGGNIHQFTLTTITKPLCYLFWSKKIDAKNAWKNKKITILDLFCDLTPANSLLLTFLTPESPPIWSRLATGMGQSIFGVFWGISGEYNEARCPEWWELLKIILFWNKLQWFAPIWPLKSIIFYQVLIHHIIIFIIYWDHPVNSGLSNEPIIGNLVESISQNRPNMAIFGLILAFLA